MKWDKFQRDIVDCKKCSNLQAYIKKIGIEKRRAYLDDTYWAKPVPGFGPESARLWILGLAPGAHGANRTGRMFTGDRSGEWLYKALYEVGLCNQPVSKWRDDALILNGVYISATVRCAPPDNKPTRDEIITCSSFLDREWDLLTNKKVLLTLGKIAFDAALNLLMRKGVAVPRPLPKFGHGAAYEIGPITIVASYHPSQQNTSTGKLTWKMWEKIFRQVKPFY